MSYFLVKTRDPNNKFDNTDITHEVTTESLDDLLPAMEAFLRGSGFYFDGELQIVPEPHREDGGDEYRSAKLKKHLADLVKLGEDEHYR
jgi:hypothetical protein